MTTLPTNRTTANTPAEHVVDHNEEHRLHNILDGSTTPSTVTAAQIAAKADLASVVQVTTNQTIAGVKTFSSAPVVPAAAFPQSAVANLVTDMAGKQPTIPAGTYAGMRTVRVTVPITGNGFTASAVGGVTDWAQRVLVALPVATTRWRLRARNYAGVAETAGAGTVTCQGAWVGTPSFSLQRWQGVFTVAPTLALSSFGLSAAGAADGASPWVTDAALQFAAGKVVGLSMGWTADATTVLRYEVGQAGLYRAGAGAAAAAGGADWSVGAAATLGTLDTRIEYEALLPSNVGVTLVCGDSIAQGYSGGDNGAYAHESWPGMAAGHRSHPVVNLGAASSTLAQWAMSSGGWKLARADLATTIPNRAIIALGTNDLASTVGTFETNLLSLLTTVRALGIQDIWVATIIPYSGSPSETNRAAINGFIRDIPRGVTGIIDFDAALRVQAAPTTAESTWITTYPHPLRAGYARMAEVARVA